MRVVHQERQLLGSNRHAHLPDRADCGANGGAQGANLRPHGAHRRSNAGTERSNLGAHLGTHRSYLCPHGAHRRAHAAYNVSGKKAA